MKWKEMLVAVCAGTAVLLSFGIHCYYVGRDDVCREAVRVGAAHYVADADGRPRFEWVIIGEGD